MTSTTCIRNSAWLVAWRQSSRRHEYLRDVDIAFSGSTIEFIGERYAGAVDEEIDGSQLFVLPGLINIHSHPSLEPNYKGIREEHGVPEMYMTGLYERCASMMPDGEGQRAGAEVSYAELLMSGVTTLADLSFPFSGWLDLAARSGLRIYIAPWYASSS